MTSRKAILTNAFHPGTELDDQALFAGRSAQVLELTQALHAEGSCPIIYGDRGLGKSSLALQVPLALGIAMAFCYGMHIFVEKPCAQLRKRMGEAKRAPRPPARMPTPMHPNVAMG